MGSVFWGAMDAVKDLFDGGKDSQQQQQHVPETVVVQLDHHAAASLYLRIPEAAAGKKRLIFVTLNP